MPQGTPEHVPDDGLTTRQRRNRPLLIVHTGPGKGKSTAAFGLALRAWNQGWPVGVFQFVKSAKWRVGEERALRLLGETGQGGAVSWNKMGEGWSWIQRDAGEHVVGAPAALGGRQALQGRLQADQLAAGHQRVQRRFLQGDPDRGPHRPRFADDVVAGDGRPAAGRQQQRRQHPHRRRLAGAVGPEEAEDLALRDGDVDALHRQYLVEGTL